MWAVEKERTFQTHFKNHLQKRTGRKLLSIGLERHVHPEWRRFGLKRVGFGNDKLRASDTALEDYLAPKERSQDCDADRNLSMQWDALTHSPSAYAQLRKVHDPALRSRLEEMGAHIPKSKDTGLRNFFDHDGVREAYLRKHVPLEHQAEAIRLAVEVHGEVLLAILRLAEYRERCDAFLFKLLPWAVAEEGGWRQLTMCEIMEDVCPGGHSKWRNGTRTVHDNSFPELLPSGCYTVVLSRPPAVMLGTVPYAKCVYGMWPSDGLPLSKMGLPASSKLSARKFIEHSTGYCMDRGSTPAIPGAPGWTISDLWGAHTTVPWPPAIMDAEEYCFDDAIRVAKENLALIEKEDAARVETMRARKRLSCLEWEANQMVKQIRAA